MSDIDPPHEHPSPHRGRVSTTALLLALWLGPAAWIGQLMLTYSVASHACFPFDIPVSHAPAQDWLRERLALGAVNLVCLLIALAGVAVAYRGWRLTRWEKAGAPRVLLDVGEGRSRFLAECGVLSGLVFSAAILFHLAAIAAVRPCWSFG